MPYEKDRERKSLEKKRSGDTPGRYRLNKKPTKKHLII